MKDDRVFIQRVVNLIADDELLIICLATRQLADQGAYLTCVALVACRDQLIRVRRKWPFRIWCDCARRCALHYACELVEKGPHAANCVMSLNRDRLRKLCYEELVECGTFSGEFCVRAVPNAKSRPCDEAALCAAIIAC